MRGGATSRAPLGGSRHSGALRQPWNQRDDQVEVVGLDRVVDEAEAASLAGAEQAKPEFPHEASTAE